MCNSPVAVFFLAPDLSRGHDAFAVAKLPPCVSCNQRNRRGSGLTHLFSNSSPGTARQALISVFENVASFVHFFFLILQPPGLTVNQFRRIAMYHIFNTLYLQRCLPGLCRSLQPYFAPRFVIHMSHFHNILNQESHGPARTVFVPAGKARNAHLKKTFYCFKKAFRLQSQDHTKAKLLQKA